MWVLVIVAVLVVAALGGIALVLLSGKGPTPPAAVTLDHVTVSAAGSTSFNQVATVVLTAGAIDNQGRDQARNATIVWSASPSGAVSIVKSPTVQYAVTILAIAAGPVTVTANATWQNATKAGTISLTVNPIHYSLQVVPAFPLVGTNYTLTVNVLDAANNLDTSYTDFVNFTASAPSNLSLPPPTLFGAGFAGTHSFTNITVFQPGPVTITATSALAPTVTGSVLITGNRPPVPQFTYTSNASDPRQVSVDASTSYDPDSMFGDSIAYYAWAFGDGVGAATGSKAMYTYASAGTYPITLYVRDTHGASNSTMQSYTAHAPPTAKFAVTKQAANGSSFIEVWFDASASTGGDGHITVYNWTFGDGSAFVLTSNALIAHNYASSYNGKTVVVNLTVTSNLSLSDTGSLSVLISSKPVPPIANFTYVFYYTNMTLWVNAANSYSPTRQPINYYNWNWGDASPIANVTSPYATHTYAAQRSYVVNLTVIDALNLKGYQEQTVNAVIPPLPPVAIFNATRALLTVNTDANLSFDYNNNIANYSWAWGDGFTTGPFTVPYAAHTYAAAGYYTITLTVTDTTNLKGTTTRHASAGKSTLDYTYHDFFNLSYGDWWDMRTIYPYGDEPLDANCFNASSPNEYYSKTVPLCTPSYPNQPTAESYPYTNWYPAPFGLLKYNNPNNDPFIYAPYRLKAVGVNQSGYNVSEPVFLPVLNYNAAADKANPVTFDWHLQYMDFNTWKSNSTCVPGNDDGFMLYSWINVSLSLAESRRIFNVPASVTPPTAQTWWNTNAQWFDPSLPAPCAATPKAVNSALSTWFNNEGNNKYDIYNSFQYTYTPFWTMVKARVNPSTGQTTVTIVHSAWGTEVLLSRWFYWGNSSYLADYLNSSKARGWWGMELAWFEDFHFSGTLNAASVDFLLDTAMQYSFQAGALPGPDGYLNQVNDVPYWIWWPILTDYFNSKTHPTELDRYSGKKYVHSTPGGYNYNLSLGYDYVPLAWKANIGEAWHFNFPSTQIPWYDPNNVTIPQDPHTYPSVPKKLALYGGTYPSNWGFWDATNYTWDVFGGEPSGVTWPCNCPGNYPLAPWGEIWFVPDAPAGALRLQSTSSVASAASIAAAGGTTSGEIVSFAVPTLPAFDMWASGLAAAAPASGISRSRD